MSDHGRMHAPGPDVADEPAPSGSIAPGQAATAQGHRRVTSFRARRSTISDRQQAIWDERWPQLGTEARHGESPAPLLDTDAWFGRQAPLILEIGCGTGTSTLAMAQAEPELDDVVIIRSRRDVAETDMPRHARAIVRRLLAA